MNLFGFVYWGTFKIYNFEEKQYIKHFYEKIKFLNILITDECNIIIM